MDETSNTATNTDSAPPSTPEAVVEPVAVVTEPTVAPASTGEPEVADVPVIQVDPIPQTPTPTTTPEPQVVEHVVEKVVEKEIVKEVPVEKIVERIVEKPVEVIKEVPVEKVVEKIVYKEAEPTDASLRSYLANFLRRVGPKGRAMQHERAIQKREAALKLFDTHEHVTQKLLRDTLKLRHSDANRVLTELREAGKIVMHEPEGGGNRRHGGRGTFYTRS